MLPLPTLGDVFADVRADQRGMRVSYHREADVLVISLWAGRTCRATFQLAGAEVARLSTLLKDVLAAAEKPADGGNPGPVALAS